MDINYKSINSSGTQTTVTKSFDWTPVNEYSSLKFAFDMTAVPDNRSTYAESGWGRIILKAVGSSKLYEVYIRIGYGHTILGFSPSVSFSGKDASITFEFGLTTDEVGLISRRDHNDV